MYQVGSDDRVRLLTDVPQSDVGAPIPVVVSDEHTTLLAYHAQPKPTLEELSRIETPTIVSPDTDVTIALITFRRVYASFFGPPNDEAFEGHPLESRGLEPYGAFEIEHSSWVREAERRNRVHPDHRPQAFDALRHFVFTFHDSIVEVLTFSDYDVEVIAASMATASRTMAERLTAS